jgi:hypothetical protein
VEDRRVSLLLAGFLAVIAASALWAVAMPAPHTGGDNAAYLSLAQSLVTGHGYTELWDPEAPPHTKYPPGFPVVLAALMAAGAASWGAFKALVGVLTLGAVLLVFAWVRRASDVVTAAGVALATLATAGWLQASRWVLSEPLFLLFLFLCLWALEPGRDARPGDAARELPGQGTPFPRPNGLRTAIGCAAAGMAVFTRTAGLPLIVAVLVAFLVAGHRRVAGIFAAALAVPGIWWLGRSLRGGEGAYQSEFWLVDPYQPELGTIGVLDLPVRFVRNVGTYVGRVVPSEWWGAAAPFAGPGARWALGIALVGLAGWGWFVRVRDRPGVPEVFAPLYAGLILVWPETWAGDRFSLPLYPLALLYATLAIRDVVATRGPALVRMGVLPVALLALVGPAVPGWVVLSEQSADCRRRAAGEDPITCHNLPFQELGAAAAWMGRNLPEDAIVLGRKPRMSYLLGGPRGRTFPFTQDPEAFLEEADAVGARYVVLDRLDGVSAFYLPPVIGGRPGAFCHIGGWSPGGPGEGGGTELFGILPPDERGRVADITVCPESWGAWPGEAPMSYRGEVPRLVQGPRPPLPVSP